MRKRSDASKKRTPPVSSSRGDKAEANKLERARKKDDDSAAIDAVELQQRAAKPGVPISGLMQEGDEISLTVGPETFFPIKFNGFHVGPLSFTTKLREDEGVDEAYGRLCHVAEVIYRTEFEIRAKQYFDRLKEVHAMRDSARVRDE